MTAQDAIIAVGLMEIVVHFNVSIKTLVVTSFVTLILAVMDVLAFIVDVCSVFLLVKYFNVLNKTIVNAVSSYHAVQDVSSVQVLVMALVSVQYHAVMVVNVGNLFKFYLAVMGVNVNTSLVVYLVVMIQYVTFVNVFKDVSFVIV